MVLDSTFQLYIGQVLLPSYQVEVLSFSCHAQVGRFARHFAVYNVVENIHVCK